MRYGIWIHGLAGRVTHGEGVPTGWVSEYDPEAFDGRGSLVTTEDPGGALSFETQAEAMDCYRAVPKSRPLRPDGKPNRPLMAFTVEIRRIDAT